MDDRFNLDFIGIGAPRCGTTWLTNCLRAHPEICLPSRKEIRYFNARDHLRDIPNENHAQPFSWYVNQFEHCLPGRIKGEFSPAYLSDQVAPRLLKQRFPEVKLLVSLRNPIDRAYSGHLMRIFHKVDDRPFEQAVAERSDSINNGFYAEQLSRYFALFAREQILVVFFEEITADPDDGLKRIFAFLGVDPSLTLPETVIRTKANATKPPRREKMLDRNSPLGRIARHPRLWPLRAAYRKIAPRNAMAPRQAREQVSELPWNYPPMTPETRAALFDLYQGDIRRLEEMLGRDLSHWR